MLVELRYADGRSYWVSINATPLRPRRQRRIYARVLPTLTDLTTRVEAERQLRGHQRALEQRVRERTADLQQARGCRVGNRAKREPSSPA